MIKRVKDKVLAAQIRVRMVKDLKVAAQIKERALVVQIRDKELAAQIRVRMVKVLKVAPQIRERALVVQTRVRMDKESKVAVQNSRKTSLGMKELKDSWNSLLPNVKKRTCSACKSSLTLSLNC